jgi:hypothetical protein
MASKSKPKLLSSKAFRLKEGRGSAGGGVGVGGGLKDSGLEIAIAKRKPRVPKHKSMVKKVVKPKTTKKEKPSWQKAAQVERYKRREAARKEKRGGRKTPIKG